MLHLGLVLEDCANYVLLKVQYIKNGFQDIRHESLG